MADDHQLVAAEDIQEDGITEFWNVYEESGINEALDLVRGRSENGDLRELEESVPFLVGEAKDRGIDMIKFLTELDAVLEEEENASGTDNRAGGVSSDSGDEADQAQDGDESESAQDADGEAREEQ